MLRRIILIITGVFILSVFIYLIFQFSLRTSQKLLLDKNLTQSESSSRNYEQEAVALSKEFAESYFSGDAFVDAINQPVVDEYKEYLRIENNLNILSGGSLQGGGVLEFEDARTISEFSRGINTYAIWLVTRIRTHSGEEKTVLFITRVKQLKGTSIIETAGAIPFTNTKKP